MEPGATARVAAELASRPSRRPARLLRLASDERLVALVRAGDDAAFEALYDRHHRALLGFCRHMLGVREEAEDALQHTFLAAYRDLRTSAKPIEARPWLFAIARNRCRSLLRERRDHVELTAAEPATDGLAIAIERREEVRELLGDVMRLPEDQRAALLLAELGELDHGAIASVLGCRRDKVKALVFQARASLSASRSARATPCAEIRAQLATASGAALRRGPLRRHLRACAGCRAFRAEVATQRRLLALALPVVPGLALKAGAMPASLAASGGTAGAWVSGGGLSGLASAGGAKFAVPLALASVTVGGGVVAVDVARQAPRHATRPVAAAPVARSAVTPARAAAPTPRSVHASPALTRRPHAPRAVDPSARRPVGHVPRAPAPRVAPASPPASATPTAPTTPSTPPTPVAPATPTVPTAPPAGSTVPAPTPTPAPSDPEPPPPAGGDDPAPGPGNPPPGGGGSDSPPGNSGNAPGHSGASPGNSGNAPGHGGNAPGNSGNAPGHNR